MVFKGLKIKELYLVGDPDHAILQRNFKAGGDFYCLKVAFVSGNMQNTGLDIQTVKRME